MFKFRSGYDSIKLASVLIKCGLGTSWWSKWHINQQKPGQFYTVFITYWGWDKICRHFADDIFKYIFLNENVWISIKLSLKFVAKLPFGNIPALVHYSDFITSATASKITGVSSVYSTVCSGADQWKPTSSASLAFVRGIHRWPVNSPHKGPVTRKMFPFDDDIMTPVIRISL